MGQHTVETFEQDGLTVKIEIDTDALNPRTEWDHLATMVCFHRRYELGDTGGSRRFVKGQPYYSEDQFGSWEELEAHIEKDNPGGVFIQPLRLYDHSGISISIGSGASPFDPGGWDSGTVGFIYVPKEKVRKEWGVKRISPKLAARVEGILEAEVNEYDQYLTGDVYGYVIEDEEGNDVDSCWGFFGFDYCVEQAKEAASHARTYETEQARKISEVCAL